MEKIERKSLPITAEVLAQRLFEIQQTLKDLGVDELLKEQGKIKEQLKGLLQDGTYITSDNVVISVMSQKYQGYTVPGGVRKLIKLEKI